MNIIELMEGAKPKLPGAPSGITIMSVDQFVQNPEADDFVDTEELDEGMFGNLLSSLKSIALKVLGKKAAKNPNDQMDFQRMMSKITSPVDSTQYTRLWQEYKSNPQFYVDTPTEKDLKNNEKMYLWANSISQFVMNRFPEASKPT